MTDTGLPAESHPAPAAAAAQRRDPVDLALTVVVWLLVAGVLALGAWWGWSAYNANKAQSLSTPALRAIESFKADVRAKPNDAALRVRLGEALAAAGLDDEALAQFSEALKIDKKHTGAWLDTGIVLAQNNDYKKAEPAFKKVVELTEGADYQDVNQRREMALFSLGQIALAQKRWEDVIKYTKGAIRIRRDASDSYLTMAKAYREMGKPAEALKNLTVALTFDPNFPEALFERGQIYMSEGKTGLAAADFRRAADLAPDSDPPKEALAALGSAQDWIAKAAKATDKRKAAELWSVAAAIDSRNIKVLAGYAKALEAAGDKKAAVRTWKLVIVIDAKNAEAKAAIARLGAAK